MLALRGKRLHDLSPSVASVRFSIECFFAGQPGSDFNEEALSARCKSAGSSKVRRIKISLENLSNSGLAVRRYSEGRAENPA
jgi:hypothetical protein